MSDKSDGAATCRCEITSRLERLGIGEAESGKRGFSQEKKFSSPPSLAFFSKKFVFQGIDFEMFSNIL